MPGAEPAGAPPGIPGGAPDGAQYDVVVAGGGLAGLTAALFAARHGWSTLVLESTVPGGQLINLQKIEDFPGFPTGVPGYDLGPMVQEQAEAEGAQFAVAEVLALEHLSQQASLAWRVVTSEGTYRAPALIVASGSRPRPLGVPGEEHLTGRGVSHCATCDGPLFKGRPVGVAGGGDAALHEAITLAGYASRVVVMHPEPDFPAQAAYRRRVAEQEAIEARHGVEVLEVLGNGALSGVRLRDVAGGAETHLDLAALFVYAGMEPNTHFLRDVLSLAPDGRIPTDGALRADLPGLFAAGDVRQDAPGYAITAAGDGATAAVSAHRYLSALR
jgi:thioredoxin reductase (NADPH)